jgi:hypothetical protein
VDYDSEKIWERRLFREVVLGKTRRQQEIQLIDQQKKEIAEEKQYIDQMTYRNQHIHLSQ